MMTCRVKQVQIGRHPAGLLIIVKYSKHSMAVMSQLSLPSDKLLLLLLQGTKAITSCRANNLQVPPCVCVLSKRPKTSAHLPNTVCHLRTDIVLSGLCKSNVKDFFNAHLHLAPWSVCFIPCVYPAFHHLLISHTARVDIIRYVFLADFELLLLFSSLETVRGRTTLSHLCSVRVGPFGSP